jgi:BirA family biotin operon repressor/biotin-[acetyl-CoA-carboxylase] ligase
MKDVTFPVFESFAAEKICAMIPADLADKNLFRLDVFDLINSTNTYLLECARQKSISGWVCFAEQQSKGRGRLGRSWYSPKGASIYCSILWNFPAQQTDLSALSLAVGVMVVDALTAYGVPAGIGLKWPNDILCAGSKMGGVLLERLPEQAGMIPVVIGIGLNLQLPEPHAANWIDLASITGEPVRRNEMAGRLLKELLMQLPEYQNKGLPGFIEEWRARDILLNKHVTIQANEKSIAGMVVGINESGELLLKKADDQIEIFRCGDVSVRY